MLDSYCRFFLVHRFAMRFCDLIAEVMRMSVHPLTPRQVSTGLYGIQAIKYMSLDSGIKWRVHFMYCVSFGARVVTMIVR